MSIENREARPWYEGVTRYQWLVLLIASLGWVFDIFEGQIFVASMNEAMPSLLPEGTSPGRIDLYNNLALASFLIGGALGGIGFGMLSDRIGRTRTMILTILMYSLFTCLTALSQTWWHMVALRFLVAMGVGGEWAVASAMVAEVFPPRARARAGGVFHASSVFGTFLAVAAGAVIVGNPAFGWRWGFAIGALPALLTLWVRWKLREPQRWVEARDVAKTDRAKQTGKIADLFHRGLIRNTLVGVSLATIGLATFWGAHIYGKDLFRRWSERPHLAQAQPQLRAAEEQVRTAADDLLAGGAAVGYPQISERLESLEPDAKAALETVLDRYFGPIERSSLEKEIEGATPQRSATLKELLQAHSGPLERRRIREAAAGADPPTAEFLNRLLVEQARPVETWYLERLPSATRKNMEQTVLKALPAAAKSSIKNWEMLGMLLVTTGGGFGLVAFGPICERIGRRRTFLFFHLGGLVSALVLFQLFATASAGFYWVALPIFGFLTLGMHAGYAIYFPELFPTRLRGTGGGFCFNGGRILAAPILIIRGWMRDDLGLGLSLETVVSILSLLFLLGVVFSLLGPETKGRELPE